MKVVVFQRTKKGVVQSSEKVGTVEIDIDVSQLSRVGNWKKMVREAVGKAHVQPIEAINVLAQPLDGCHVSVTLGLAAKGFGRSKKPVARGGKPIAPPQKRRTMPGVARG
jgi:hypothetical protein